MGFCDWLLRVAPNGKSSRSSRTLVILLIASLLVHKGGGEECGGPLGMESGKIASSQITASSSFDLKSVGPQNARIRKEQDGGAWCPKSVIQRDVREFIEVDLLTEHRITATETQGRFGNGVGREFTEKLTFEFWRARLGKWVEYRDSRGRTIFDGNGNTYTGVKQELVPPIFASKLRFIPHSIHPRTVCMRVEVYGCFNHDGILSYDVPQGYYSHKGGDYDDFRDSLYDGHLLEHSEANDSAGKTFLSGGRGLLTDTIFGQKDFTQSKVNGWMGWRNESTPIKIQFHFDRLRKFEAVKVHVSNLLAYNAQVFASATIFSSVDGGNKVSKNPIVWTPEKNRSASVLMELIPLKGIIASFIRLEFTHSNKWLLISEISFDSEPINADLPFETEAAHSLDSSGQELNHEYRSQNISLATIVGVVIGCVSVCLVLSTALALCFLRRRNGRNTKLIGIIGMPTPKSMSVGNGLNNTNSTTSGSSGGGHISTISGNTSNNESLGFGKKGEERGELTTKVSKFKPLTMQQHSSMQSERKLCLLNSSSVNKAMSRELLNVHTESEVFEEPTRLVRKNERVGMSGVGEYENVGIIKEAGQLSGCKTLNPSSVNTVNVNSVVGVDGSVNSSCTSTVKATESDSSSSSGYASTFSQQLRRKRSGDDGWREKPPSNVPLQFTELDPTLQQLPHPIRLQLDHQTVPSSSGDMTISTAHRHLESSRRFLPKLPSSVSSPLRCFVASSTSSHFLPNAQAPAYSPTVRRLILPHEYSNASSVSYCPKINFNHPPDILNAPPNEQTSSGRLGTFSSPKVNSRRPKKSTGVATIGRDHSYVNPLIPHQDDQSSTARRAPYYYREMAEQLCEAREDPENSYYAVCDIFNPNPYQDRRF